MKAEGTDSKTRGTVENKTLDRIPIRLVTDWIENELKNYVKFTSPKKRISEAFEKYAREAEANQAD